MASSMSSTFKAIALSGLRTSCATLAAIRPTAASLSARTNAWRCCRNAFAISLNSSPIWPISSLLRTLISAVRSPLAICRTPAMSWFTGRKPRSTTRNRMIPTIRANECSPRVILKTSRVLALRACSTSSTSRSIDVRRQRRRQHCSASSALGPQHGDVAFVRAVTHRPT